MNDAVQQAEQHSWWRRACGPREVLVLALPLIVSTASWSLMHFTDRAFLYSYSEAAMAATMPAGILHFALLCFPLGVATYVSTFVAQYEGAGQRHRVGAVVWQGVRVGLFCVPLLLATIPLAPWIFHAAGHDPEVAMLEVVYYQVLTFGGGAAIIAAALSSFFTGRGRPGAVMLVSVTSASLNIALDYLWIFGVAGFPELGIEGAAWGTVVAQWYRVAAYGWLLMRPKHVQAYDLRAGRRFDFALLRRLLRFGGPNGLQMLVEIAGFTLFIMLVGWLGKDALAATTVAFNVNLLAFVPMLGLGVAISTMVGQQLGAGRPHLAARATWTGLWMAMAYMGTMALLYLLVPDLFLMAHAAAGTKGYTELRDVTVVLLRFVAAYCLFDALNVVFVSAIKGAGDTRFVLAVNVVLSPLPVLAGWLGVTYFGLGLIWCWVVLTAWAMAQGLTYCARFLQGRWRQMRVIEPDLLVQEEPPAAVAEAVGVVEPAGAAAGGEV